MVRIYQINFWVLTHEAELMNSVASATQATELAESKLEQLQVDIGIPLQFSPTAPILCEGGYYFPYNSREVFETGNPLTGLVGNVPIVVRSDGTVEFALIPT